MLVPSLAHLGGCLHGRDRRAARPAGVCEHVQRSSDQSAGGWARICVSCLQPSRLSCLRRTGPCCGHVRTWGCACCLTMTMQAGCYAHTPWLWLGIVHAAQLRRIFGASVIASVDQEEASQINRARGRGAQVCKGMLELGRARGRVESRCAGAC